MSTETPQETIVPTNDAQAAQQEAALQTAVETTEAPETPAAKPDKPNRTGQYIERLQGRVRERDDENAQLRAELARYQHTAHHSTQPQNNRGAGEGEPTLAQYDYDLEAYTRAHGRWTAEQVTQERETAARQQTEQRTFQDKMSAYAERAEAFTEQNPDYPEAIDTFFSAYQPSEQIQLAIIGHERGPEIAYYVANNDDEAFTLANTLPQNAAAAVSRLLKRMDAAQQAAAPAAPAAPIKQVSKAPAPTPTVAGRSAVIIPSEKMTDDQWYKADLERRRKR